MYGPPHDERAWPDINVDDVLSPNNGRKPERLKVLKKKEHTEPIKENRSFTLKS